MEQQQLPCKSAEKELLLCCYDELDDGRRQLLQEHLSGCDPCRKEFVRLGEVLRLLRPVTLDCSAADLHRFSNRLATRLGQRRSLFPRLPLAAASLMLVILAFVAPWQSEFSPDQRTVSSTQPPVDLGMIEAFDFYQNLEVLEVLDLFKELEPQG